jgi:tight adherence protein C
MEPIAASILASVAVLAGLVGLASRRDPWLLRQLGPALRTRRREPLAPRLVRRLGRSSIARRLPGRDRRVQLLESSGLHVPIEELTGMKLILGSAGGVLALIAPAWGPIIAPVLFLVGVQAPDLWLAARARRRLALADREIPLLLDLLAAGSSAGLSAPLALRRAVGVIGGPLAEELGTVVRATDLGARWRDEMRATAERLALADLCTAMAALTRTESLGASLADSMSRLASQVREERRAELSERARKAPVKMLFPLVFLVLPAFLLLTVVPLLVTTLRSIR